MNDVEFIHSFLTPEFAGNNQLFTFRRKDDKGAYEIESRDFEKIKKSLLDHLSNGGEPIIKILDANYGNRSELFLEHLHSGVDLKLHEARQTLHALYRIWRRTVNLKTSIQGNEKILTYNGSTDSER